MSQNVQNGRRIGGEVPAGQDPARFAAGLMSQVIDMIKGGFGRLVPARCMKPFQHLVQGLEVLPQPCRRRSRMRNPARVCQAEAKASCTAGSASAGILTKSLARCLVSFFDALRRFVADVDEGIDDGLRLRNELTSVENARHRAARLVGKIVDIIIDRFDRLDRTYVPSTISTSFRT